MENDPKLGYIIPGDPINIAITRKKCVYRWRIPYEVYKSTQFQNMKEPYRDEDLQALGCTLIDIVVLNSYSIDFKQKTGVRKLEVFIRSSESEDRQLLHKITSEFRANDQTVDRDSIPGTTNNEHE